MLDSLDNVYYYLNDHLGSAGMLIASDGTVRDRYRYKAFGGVESGQSVNVGQSYRYTGKPLDEELGMNWYYYGARYYNPDIGRFLSPDILKQYASPYTYCGNNPIKVVDPDGRYGREVHYDLTRMLFDDEVARANQGVDDNFSAIWGPLKPKNFNLHFMRRGEASAQVNSAIASGDKGAFGAALHS